MNAMMIGKSLSIGAPIIHERADPGLAGVA